MAQYGLVLVTTASVEEAELIARTLVTEQYVAGVNMMPIQSIYAWRGEIHQEPEYQLIMQTDLDYFSQLSEKIRSLHSYEVPEIIGLPITCGYAPYLNWIGEHVQPGSPPSAE